MRVIDPIDDASGAYDKRGPYSYTRMEESRRLAHLQSPQTDHQSFQDNRRKPSQIARRHGRRGPMSSRKQIMEAARGSE